MLVGSKIKKYEADAQVESWKISTFDKLILMVSSIVIRGIPFYRSS